MPRVPQVRIRNRQWKIITDIAQREERPVSNVVELLLDRGLAARAVQQPSQDSRKMYAGM